MKKNLFLLLIATLLWSCQNATFTIKGTVADPALEGANVYLQERVDNNFVTLETAVVHNGTFTFTGMAIEDADVVYRISLDGHPSVFVFPERGITKVAFGDVTTVSGTRANTLFHEFRVESDRFMYERTNIFLRLINESETLTDELRGEMFVEHAELTTKIEELTTTFIRNNIENRAGRHVLITWISGFSSKTQEELIALADDNLRNYPAVARIITRLENARNVAVGKRFVDFTLNDPEGNEVSLSDFAGQGNYVLLSFWATWCGPCIQIIPHLKELYARYKSKGFEIVGVSLDRSHDDWVAGIERLNIPWIQMSDLKMWQSPVVELYAFIGIPHSLLLDREGTIIATNLRGDELERKLAELMP